jgi:hypothetical protein
MLAGMLMEAESAYENDILLAGVVIRALPLLIPYFKEHHQVVPQIISRILSRYKHIQWTGQDDDTRRALVRCINTYIHTHTYAYMTTRA